MERTQHVQLHLLRSRVAVIKGYAQLLHLRLAGPQPSPDHLTLLNERQLAQIERLLAQLDAWGRHQALAGRSRGMDAPTPEQRQTARKHIFAVNGSPDFLDIVRTLLQDEHYNVTTTNFVPRTFDQIAVLQPDLLLVDLEVGQRLGWELLEHLQQQATTSGIPVIITSTDVQLLERAEREQVRFGGQVRLVKPFDLGELVAAVQHLIGTADVEAPPAEGRPDD